MKKLLNEILSRETSEAKIFLANLERLEHPVELSKVKDFFEFIMQISAKTLSLQQIIYGKLKVASNDPMFEGMSSDQKERFTLQLEEMTRAKMQNELKKGKSETHLGLLSVIYENLYPDFVAEYVVTTGHNRENRYLLELELVDSLYRTAKQKITVAVALLQVIQYLEPFIIKAMRNIVVGAIDIDGASIYPEVLPRYITEHEAKGYIHTPIVLEYYNQQDAESIIKGYCREIAHVFNHAFTRIDTLVLVQQDDSGEPHSVGEH